MMLNRGKANGGQVLKPETVHLMSRFVTADPGSILVGAQRDESVSGRCLAVCLTRTSRSTCIGGG
jgi:hypothetical protein